MDEAARTVFVTGMDLDVVSLEDITDWLKILGDVQSANLQYDAVAKRTAYRVRFAHPAAANAAVQHLDGSFFKNSGVPLQVVSSVFTKEVSKSTKGDSSETNNNATDVDVPRASISSLHPIVLQQAAEKEKERQQQQDQNNQNEAKRGHGGAPSLALTEAQALVSKTSTLLPRNHEMPFPLQMDELLWSALEREQFSFTSQSEDVLRANVQKAREFHTWEAVREVTDIALLLQLVHAMQHRSLELKEEIQRTTDETTKLNASLQASSAPSSITTSRGGSNAAGAQLQQPRAAEPLTASQAINRVETRDAAQGLASRRLMNSVPLSTLFVDPCTLVSLLTSTCGPISRQSVSVVEYVVPPSRSRFQFAEDDDGPENEQGLPPQRTDYTFYLCVEFLSASQRDTALALLNAVELNGSVGRSRGGVRSQNGASSSSNVQSEMEEMRAQLRMYRAGQWGAPPLHFLMPNVTAASAVFRSRVAEHLLFSSDAGHSNLDQRVGYDVHSRRIAAVNKALSFLTPS
jgi:hypothetical protein